MQVVGASVPLLIVVAVVLIAGAGLLLLPGLLLRSRAKRDYRNARGTQHRQYIEQAVAAVRVQVGLLQADVERLDDRLAGLDREASSELDQALARHLVTTKLDDVPGLGPTRVRAIVDNVFQSRLSDLHSASAHENISNIGPKTQMAISNWVHEMESRWPQLRSDAFPGKQPILDRFSFPRRDLERQRTALTDRITTLQALERQGEDELLRLSAITVDDFRRVLTGRKEAKAPEAIQRYILGAFAPWAMVPAWYADLLTAAEGEGTDGRDA